MICNASWAWVCTERIISAILSWVTETNQRATCLHSFQSPNSNLGNRRSTSFLLTLTLASSSLSHQLPPYLHTSLLFTFKKFDSHLKERLTRIWKKEVWLASERKRNSHLNESVTRMWRKVWLASVRTCDSHLKESVTRIWTKVWLASERKFDSHVKESAIRIWKKLWSWLLWLWLLLLFWLSWLSFLWWW